MDSKSTTQDTMRVRFPPNLLEDGQIGKALGSELSNFIGSTPIPRIKKSKSCSYFIQFGFLFYTARFFTQVVSSNGRASVSKIECYAFESRTT